MKLTKLLFIFCAQALQFADHADELSEISTLINQFKPVAARKKSVNNQNQAVGVGVGVSAKLNSLNSTHLSDYPVLTQVDVDPVSNGVDVDVDVGQTVSKSGEVVEVGQVLSQVAESTEAGVDLPTPSDVYNVAYDANTGVYTFGTGVSTWMHYDANSVNLGGQVDFTIDIDILMRADETFWISPWWYGDFGQCGFGLQFGYNGVNLHSTGHIGSDNVDPRTILPSDFTWQAWHTIRTSVDGNAIKVYISGMEGIFELDLGINSNSIVGTAPACPQGLQVGNRHMKRMDSGNMYGCQMRNLKIYNNVAMGPPLPSASENMPQTIKNLLGQIKQSITDERTKTTSAAEGECTTSVDPNLKLMETKQFTGTTKVDGDATDYTDLVGCSTNSECEKETEVEQAKAINAHNEIKRLEAEMAPWITDEEEKQKDKTKNEKEKGDIEKKKEDHRILHEARMKKFGDAIEILKRINEALADSGEISSVADASSSSSLLGVSQEEKNVIRKVSPVGNAVLLMIDQAMTGDVEKDLVVTLKKLLKSCIDALQKSKDNEKTTHDHWITLRDAEIEIRDSNLRDINADISDLTTKIANHDTSINTEKGKKEDALTESDTLRGACVTDHTDFKTNIADFTTELDAIDKMFTILEEAKLGDETVKIREEDDSTKHGVKESVGGIGAWELAMNINPSDGHNSGWAGQITQGASHVVPAGQLSYWDSDIDFGSVANALTEDFKDKTVFKSKTARWIAIARHQAGTCDGYKVWKMQSPDTLLNVFLDSYRTQISTGGEVAGKTDVTSKSADPIFEKDGRELFANYYYSNNGNRLTIRHDSMAAEGVNTNVLWGIGVDSASYEGNTQKSGSTGGHWGDVGNNGHNGFGTDRGSGIGAVAKIGDYAIYVSEQVGDTPPEFLCDGTLPGPE